MKDVIEGSHNCETVSCVAVNIVVQDVLSRDRRRGRLKTSGGTREQAVAASVSTALNTEYMHCIVHY